MTPVTLDYETFYIKPTASNGGGYSVRGLGNWRYCHDERFNAYLVAVFDGQEGWVGNPKDLNWGAVEGRLKLAHNAAFDGSVTNRLGELQIAPKAVLDDNWQCTANLSSFLASSRSLADAVFSLEGRRLDKTARDDMNGKTWEDAQKLGLAEKFAKYALQDAIECHNLWTKHSSRWPQFEQDISRLTMKQCARGIAINVELLKRYRAVLAETIFKLEKSLPWVAEGRAPTSPKAVADYCRLHRIPVPPTKKEDEEGFDKWELTYRANFPWVAGVGMYRQLNKLATTLETIEERLRPDNTIDFSLLYFGAHTGRWSGGGSGLNMQNLRKTPIYIRNREVVSPPAGISNGAMSEWLATLDIALDVRALFVARAGKKFIISDLSQVEPRVLNWLAGNEGLLAAMRAGYSYYEAYARLVKNWKGAPGSLKKEFGLERYTLLKNEALGLGYGMGWKKYTDYASVAEETAKEIVSGFRQNNPLVVALWNNLSDGLQHSIGGDYDIQLPSGRSMIFRNVRREVRLEVNEETGKREAKLNLVANVGPRRSKLYGGKLAENITQATARDVFGFHALAVERDIGDLIFHAHDEAIVECDLDVPAKEVERAMSVTPPWLEGCPLTAEAIESAHYLK